MSAITPTTVPTKTSAWVRSPATSSALLRPTPPSPIASSTTPLTNMFKIAAGKSTFHPRLMI
jgi:hypothetical protein